MSDPQQPPEPGSPEYEWLYGATPPPEAPADDRTRVLPAQTTPTPAPRATPATPVARPAAAPQRAPRPAPSRGVSVPRVRPWKWAKRLVLITLVVAIGWLSYLVWVPYHALGDIERVGAFPTSGRPADQPGTNYLVVGSDSRAGLSPAQRKRLGTGSATGQRTDTIMVLHVGDGPNVLLSIPRDSLVDVPGYGVTKINAAFAYGGPQLLTQTVENATGLYIDHYVEIGLGGFVNIVDAVDGIRICPTEDMVDPLAKLNIKKGCQPADGATALGYARSRHTSTLGDIDRARHQREVVSAVGRKVVRWQSVVNPWSYWEINQAAASSVRLSEDTGVLAMTQFARAMTSLTGDKGRTCAVPLADLSVRWDAERADQFFGYLIADNTSEMPPGLCTASGFPKQK